MAALSGVIAGLTEKLQVTDDGCETETSKIQVHCLGWSVFVFYRWRL